MEDGRRRKMKHPRDTLLYAALLYAASEHGDETQGNYGDELDLKQEILERATIEYAQFIEDAKPVKG
jgi:hypothetical protein